MTTKPIYSEPAHGLDLHFQNEAAAQTSKCAISVFITFTFTILFPSLKNLCGSKINNWIYNMLS